jgi:hypothetical protein
MAITIWLTDKTMNARRSTSRLLSSEAISTLVSGRKLDSVRELER